MTDKQRFLQARKDHTYIESTYGLALDNAEAYEGAFILIFGRGGADFSFDSAADLVVSYIKRLFRQGYRDNLYSTYGTPLPVDSDIHLQQIRRRWSI